MTTHLASSPDWLEALLMATAAVAHGCLIAFGVRRGAADVILAGAAMPVLFWASDWSSWSSISPWLRMAEVCVTAAALVGIVAMVAKRRSGRGAPAASRSHE